MFKDYLKESVSNLISIIGEIRSYRMLYTASSIWAKEVDHAYELCQQNLPSDVFSSVKADHEAWLSTQHADLADIRADGQQAGGTLGSVQIATDSAAYYEKEAKKLYQVLYENNISYQYQFEE